MNSLTTKTHSSKRNLFPKCRCYKHLPLPKCRCYEAFASFTSHPHSLCGMVWYMTLRVKEAFAKTSLKRIFLCAGMNHVHCSVEYDFHGLMVKASSSSGNLLILSYLSRSLADRWGTAVDFTTSFLHSLQLSAFLSMLFHSRPVHSLILSSHRFLCLPLRLPP